MKAIQIFWRRSSVPSLCTFRLENIQANILFFVRGIKKAASECSYKRVWIRNSFVHSAIQLVLLTVIMMDDA